jgi:RNA polymerase sigma factor (sigma-70 family)
MRMSAEDRRQESVVIRLQVLANLYANNKISADLYEKAINDVDMLQGKKRDMSEYCDYHYSSVSRELINVQRSKAWSDSWGDRIKVFHYGVTTTQLASVTHSGMESRIDLQKAVGLLDNDKLKQIVILLCHGYSIIEIAKKLGNSREHISRLQTKAIDRMREILC